MLSGQEGGPMTNETIILSALENCEMSRLEIKQVTGIRTGALRPALLRLEERGEIVSSWDETQHPECRVYRVASPPRAETQS
jgi:DNA-binding PadR family transcriptional regulator